MQCAVSLACFVVVVTYVCFSMDKVRDWCESMCVCGT